MSTERIRDKGIEFDGVEHTGKLKVNHAWTKGSDKDNEEWVKVPSVVALEILNDNRVQLLEDLQNLEEYSDANPKTIEHLKNEITVVRGATRRTRGGKPYVLWSRTALEKSRRGRQFLKELEV